MNFFKKLFLKHCLLYDSPVTLSLNFDKKEYYQVNGMCSNCDKELNLYIKKGIYVKYAVINIICPNCGCKIDKELK